MGDTLRPGEQTLAFDPGARADASVCFIGHIRSPWGPDTETPKNIGKARATGQDARIELADGFGDGLLGLKVGQPLIVTYWMHLGRRDLIVQAPRHADGPCGTFALRSPRRPNPMAMSTVLITSLDQGAGVIGIDAIDAFDRTPVVDIKPWLGTVDLPPNR
ncbi:TrmO family methyltransferase domain-containing protein [Meridianimarinicoccus aquatilis]|uniref:S-adenosylmethionine-dependent methyltransferase n=1 Tax=Meridianimarinicoccus aquatilis TaxID=2552766 RepID=A0A4R6ATX0_9RHOB|nr:TrmO family methyltransferase [Fluviibacterium aquatile]TDL86984.1 S-adenosylmethionine-dependent methyltransferase [Fluviibacterium aquatile]